MPSAPRSASGKGRRAAPAVLLSLILGLAMCCSMPGAFVAGGAPRRMALGGLLLPLLAPAAPGAAGAEETLRVSRPLPGGGSYSFELPLGGAKDWVANGKVSAQESLYERKDGAFIGVTPVEAGYVKARFNGEAGPANGFKLEKYKLGEAHDDLEWTRLATLYRGAAGGGALIGGFLFQDGDPTSSHQWIRVLHGPQGDVMMSIALNQDDFRRDGAKLKAVLDSFRLEA